jgi:Tol biopolymer transport system component
VLVETEGQACSGRELDLVDVLDGSAERIDVSDDGDGAQYTDEEGGMFYNASISADGRYVAFKSRAWNLIPGQSYPGSYQGPGGFDQSLVHAYVRDRQERSTNLVGLGPAGQIPPATEWSAGLALSGDGRKLAVTGNTGPGTVFDVTTGAATVLGFPYSWSHLDTQFRHGSMSGDGRSAVFGSQFYVVAGRVVFTNLFAQTLP